MHGVAALVKRAIMFFAAPWWLIGLAPWGALAVWLLRGRRRRVRVPFVAFWKDAEKTEPPRRGFQWPPAWVMLAMVAALLAILGAGRPHSRWPAGGQPITIIVDRGITMSAGNEPRFRQVARRVEEHLSKELSSWTAIHLVDVPGSETTARVSNWRSLIDAMPVTAIDTRDALIATVHQKLKESTGLVIAISDQQIDISDPRLIQCPPSTPVDAILISRIAARDKPAAQIMVELLNESARSKATVQITTGDQTSSRTVDLPPRGQRANYFFEPRSVGERIEATVIDGGAPANSHAWLVREGSFPKIQIETTLDPAVQRMIDVYTRNRPPTNGGETVRVCGSLQDLPDDGTSIVVSPSRESVPFQSLSFASHPILEHVDPQSISADGLTISSASPRGWTPLISMGDRTLAAYRTEPHRAVWIGFDSPAWERTPSFVIFWANLLDWVGSGGQGYVGHPLTDVNPAWQMISPTGLSPAPLSGQWPGLYKNPSDGQIVAVNAPVIESNPFVDNTWPARHSAALADGSHGFDLTRILLALALLFGLSAILTVNRPNLTPYNVARTF